ncbi:MAG: prepilin-type N-terminal cleavage/methylation domain-containing protein [Candidatus Staskawiczbacteria bacterium]|nr:prepilin-type N-terminal cleavage/methylation domain-containing protein [Candidatus Staskawiczbacteria bacterium]
MMQKQKGFTIIELIVVIAIIAVLAAIVMVNVTIYIGKSKDAAIKGDLNSLLNASVIYSQDPAGGNGNFNGFCDSSAVGKVKTALEGNMALDPFLSCLDGGNAIPPYPCDTD